MGVLDKLEPKKVFGFFEDICGIPHGSYNLEKIREYLISFAKERNLEYIADDFGNVIIKKDAYPGYEKEAGIILQGHMDMVAVCEEGSGIDMKVTAPDIFIDGDKIGAKKTSLGGDDGIAVAMILSILDSDDIPHPRLEAVITANEETGMEGAAGMDMSLLSGESLINLDSEDEGIIISGCAGGARVKCTLPAYSEDPADMIFLNVSINGLQGGHSGQMIGTGRGNANILLGRILSKASRTVNKGFLVNAEGGSAHNAIPSCSSAIIAVSALDVQKFTEEAKKEADCISMELGDKDPGFCFTVSDADKKDLTSAHSIDLKKASAFIYSFPYGVISMCSKPEGLVETSLNMGILKQDENGLTAEFSVRSSLNSARDALIMRLEDITSGFGGTSLVSGIYPGWKYRVDSPLREKMMRIFKEMYSNEPKVEAIHAGLECGFFVSKNEKLDAVSIGPDMQDIHSPSERLSISSTARTYEYLLKILAAH